MWKGHKISLCLSLSLFVLIWQFDPNDGVEDGEDDMPKRGGGGLATYTKEPKIVCKSNEGSQTSKRGVKNEKMHYIIGIIKRCLGLIRSTMGLFCVEGEKIKEFTRLRR